MPKIIFKGWKIGMRGIPFQVLLRNHAGLSLKQAQDVKLKVLDNEEVELAIVDIETARYISIEAELLGVINEIIS